MVRMFRSQIMLIVDLSIDMFLILTITLMGIRQRILHKLNGYIDGVSQIMLILEQVWLQDEGCHATVEEVWVSSQGYMSPLVSVKTKLERVQTGLKNWSKNSLVFWLVIKRLKAFLFSQVF